MIRSAPFLLALLIAIHAHTGEAPVFSGSYSTQPETHRGWEQFHNGDLDAGLASFAAALAKKPTDSAALFGQALHALAMSDYQLALERLCLAVDGAKDSPWSELYVHEVVNALPYSSNEKPFLDLCARAEGPGYRPHLKSQLLAAKAAWLQQRGQFAAATEAARRVQYLSRWALAGPFDNRDNAGFETVYAPETSIDFAAPVAGRNRSVQWFQPAAEPTDGRMDLGEVFEPNTHVLAYAVTFVDAPEAGWAVLRAGFSGSFAVWVNDQKAASVPELNQFGADKVVVPVYIQKGWNRILVKTGVVEDTDWIFTARLSKADGNPLAFTKVDSSAAALEAWKASGKRSELPPKPAAFDLGLRAELETELQREPGNVPALFALGSVLHWQNFGDREQNPDAKQLRKALTLAPKSPFLRLRLATIAEDRNEARQAAELALASHPSLPALHETLAILASENQQEMIAADLAARARKKFGPERTGAATIVLAATLTQQDESTDDSLDVRDSSGVGGRAYAARLLDEVLARHPYLAEGWRKFAMLQASRHDRLAVLKRGLEKCGGDAVLRAKYASELAAMEKDSDALALEEADLANDPFNITKAVEVSKRAMSAGDAKKELAILEQARANAPESADLLEALATAKHRAGETSQAVELLRDVLRIKPNSPRVRDFMALLDATPDDRQRFFSPYDIQLKDLSMPDPRAFPNDNVVNVLNQTVVRLNANGSSSRMIHYVAKVLRPAGVQELSFHNIYYDPERQVVDIIKASVITPEGRELARADVQDRSTSAMAGVQTRIYDEHHLKQVRFKELEPGATIDLQYTIRDTGLNIYGDYFADSFNLADDNPTIRSQYVLDTPASLNIQTQVLNAKLEPKPGSTQDPQRKTLVWELNNTPGIVRERNMPPAVDKLAQLQVTTMNSWQDVGQWYWNLAKESLVPSEEMKAAVAEITKDAKNDREKLRMIHDWVIAKIRYLGIEFGRNGYKPHRAADSFKSLYGDCKDTATLITSMLQVAGIESRLVLIRTTDAGAVPENSLPMPNLFNHCIAYVPKLDGRDYWIDCTTDFHQLGEVPYADENAQVLVVGKTGGTFVRIPRSAPQDNMVEQKFEAKVARDGAATLKMRDVRHGQFAPSYRELAETPGQYERFMREFAARKFNGAEVVEMSRADRKDQGPMWMETTLKVPQLASRSGERKALPATLDPLGLSNRFTGDTKRTNDVELYFAWKRVSETVYDLDAALTVLSVPEELDLKEAFGLYSRKVLREASRVTIRETFELSRASVKAEEYEAFKSFCNKVDNATDQKVLLEVR